MKTVYSIYYSALLAIPALLPGVAYADTKIVAVVQVTSSQLTSMSKEERAMMAVTGAHLPMMKIMTGIPVTCTHYHQGGHDRFDFGNNLTVEDRATDHHMEIDKGLKVYTIRPITTVRKPVSHDETEDFDHMTAVDKHETKQIAGYTASHYVLRAPRNKPESCVIQVWMSPALPSGPFLPPIGSDLFEPFDRAIAKLPGLCLEMHSSTHDKDGTYTIAYNVKSVSSQPISPAVFNAPQGFQENAWGRNLLESQDEDPQTQLVDAAAGHDLDQIKSSLKSGVDVNTTDEYGLTPLLASLRWPLNGTDSVIDVVTLLLDRGANVNTSVPPDGVTPLMEAAARGETEAVKLLLTHGANLELKDKNGKTALDHATDQRQVDAIKLLATVMKL